MNREQIHGHFQNFIGRFERSLGQVTHNDELLQKGVEEQFEGVLEAKYGILKERRNKHLRVPEKPQPDNTAVYKRPFHPEIGFTTAEKPESTMENVAMTQDQPEEPKPGLAMSDKEATQCAKNNLAAESPKHDIDSTDGQNKKNPPARVSNIPRGNDNPNNVSGSVRGSGG